MFKKLRIWLAKRQLRRIFTARPNEIISAKQLAWDLDLWLFKPDELATAMMTLVGEGFIKGGYQIADSNGNCFAGWYDDPREMPERIYDPNLNGMRDTAPLDVMSVFVKKQNV